MVGKTVAHYQILQKLGEGGMGVVYKARDTHLDRLVAIKVLAARYWPDKTLADRFMREAQAMAQLSHPNVASIYSLGSPEEPPHFVMEYIHGRQTCWVASYAGELE